MSETGMYNEGDVTETFKKQSKGNKVVYDTNRVKIECYKEFADVTMGGILSFAGETRAESDRACYWQLFFDGKLYYRQLKSPRSVHDMISGIGIGIGALKPIDTCLKKAERIDNVN